ncbi:MAG: Clp protease ClpP, partial [Clostridia bacterium]|nr:Clp protease ClpP [Clostridia bacterium]
MKINGNIAYIGEITAFPLSEYPEFETQTSANQMIDFLQNNGDVELYINSQGGDVFEAMQIYNTLRRHSRNHSVKVYVDGLSASAASYLMFGGSELFVPKNATIMIHKPTTLVWGDADELRTSANALDVIQSSIES